MSLSNARAKEILELCMAEENPAMRLLVYEIIDKSGLDPSDPLFLVLALTGQIKVFLEAAPMELRQLLDDWKRQNADSLSQIQTAIELAQKTREEQIKAIKETLEKVSWQYVSDLKKVGMATTSAIAEANGETLERVQHLKDEVDLLSKQLESLHTNIEADRQTNRDKMNSLVEKFQHTAGDLHRANAELKNSIWSAKKFQQQTSWARRAEWFTPLFALLIMAMSGAVAGIWLTSRYYNSPSQQLGRKLTKWNQQQLTECVNNSDTQCTIRLVP